MPDDALVIMHKVLKMNKCFGWTHGVIIAAECVKTYTGLLLLLKRLLKV